MAMPADPEPWTPRVEVLLAWLLVGLGGARVGVACVIGERSGVELVMAVVMLGLGIVLGVPRLRARWRRRYPRLRRHRCNATRVQIPSTSPNGHAP